MALIVDLYRPLAIVKSKNSDRIFEFSAVAENGVKFGCAVILKDDEAAVVNEAIRCIQLALARENGSEVK